MVAVQPNLTAYAALLIWPLAALVVYSRLSITQATLWTILGGYLLLPVGAEIKFEHIPAFNKGSIPSLAALVCCALWAGRLPKVLHGFGLAEGLIAVLLVGPFMTSELNGDPIHIAQTFLPGVGSYDALSASAAEFISIVPFFLGRQFLRDARTNEDILRILVVAGLVYSLPMLFEVRMSPQLHTWVYGYFPSSFLQQMRDGGFRPVVFLGHGLLVALFAMTTAVAAAALWRMGPRIGRWPSGGITAYLSVVLVFCKTGSALLYGAVLLPLVRWASPRLQMRVACVLVAIAVTYPLLRVADLVPTASILEVAGMVDADRAASLKTRFDNEDQLLAHAWERKWFGWGRFGRNRVYNGWMGRDSSITDGTWIVTLGVFGLVGFAAEFGLLGLAVTRAAGALRHAQTMQEACCLAALALIVAINIFDLLPNSSISPWTWLLAGSLLGRAEALRAAAPQRARAVRPAHPPMELQRNPTFPL